jgi:N-acyl-D-amino-acid deacylase
MSRGFDLLFRRATVFAGDGPPRLADVAVTGSRIVAVDRSLPAEGTGRVVDAGGHVLCPGFIDLHAHSALEPFHDPSLAPKIGQGFTTEVINPDGLAPAPVARERWEERRASLLTIEGRGPEPWTWSTVAEYLDALEATAPTTTLVPSAAHNAIRDLVLGGAARGPTDEELRFMREEVRRAFEAGARTLSFGLVYPPGVFAATDELVALASEAARFDVPLVTHVRNEAAGILEAVEEMVDVARRAGAPLHLSHLKVVGSRQLLDPLLALLDRASTEIDLTFDQYPYGAGVSMLVTTVLPPWALEGGSGAILRRLREPSERVAIARDVARGLAGWENLFEAVGPDAIVIAGTAPPREGDVGKTLAEVAAERGTDPLTAALDLLEEAGLEVASIEHYAEEQVVREIARHRLHLVGSDGVFSPKPHPRLFGTAPRFLGRYAMREGLIAVGEAVAQLTARAADRLRLRDRGRVRSGLRADLVLLDPLRFVDSATYEDPARPPEGLLMVVVGGRVVWEDGSPTGERPGGVLREPITGASA